MKTLQKVIWHEGMFLKPHHFQQAERHGQIMLNARIRAVARHDWGLSEIQIDRAAVGNGEINLLSCRGVLPDGLAFDAPEIHPLPAAQSFQKIFTPKLQELGVFLVIPREKPAGGNCQMNGKANGDATRYQLQQIELRDDNSGENEQDIAIGLPNLQIRFGKDLPPGFTGIQIARLVRQENDQITLDERFVPPCLHLKASPPLAVILKSLLGFLLEKSSTLSERRQRQSSGQVTFSNVDVKTFWLLHTVNSFIPLLNHLERLPVPGCHPEELYQQMLTLAGQLKSFSDSSDMSFPRYEHQQLKKCFYSLYNEIRKLLDQAVPPANYLRIPLTSRDRSLYAGQIVDESLFRGNTFYLVMRGEFNERQIEQDLPMHIKIGSPDEIQQLAESAVQGVKISSVSRPPVGPPSGPGLHYFRLNPSGIYWDNVRRSQRIAILFPAAYKALTPMLLAVQENG